MLSPAKLQKDFQLAKAVFEQAQKILILSHRNPDGDAIGANLALTRALREQWGKNVVSAAIDPLPENSTFLTGANDFVMDFNPDDFDAYASVDCGASYMTNFHKKYPQMWEKKKPFVNIDHHASNDFFGTVNVVDPDAASATQVLYHFLNYCGLIIDRDIATALLHGLYFDTGSFMHSNTTPEVLRIGSALLEKGADFRTIAKRQFKTTRVPQLKLWGRVFDRIHVTPKKVARSFLTQADFEETGAKPEDTTGAIDYLNSVPEGRFCTLIAEDKNGTIKGSLRTRTGDVDLSKLAGLFGGGGHKKASGFSVPATISLSKDKENKLEINP